MARFGTIARRTLVLVVFAAWASGVLAQDVTGTIDGTLGGEPRTWVTLALETEDGIQGTASWNLLMDRIWMLTLQGHPEPRFGVEQAIAIDVTHLGGVPASCPCTFDNAEVLYWTTSSIFSDVYASESATVVIDEIEPIGDDAYRMAGSFRAVLTYQESATAEPDPSDTLDVVGAFAIERVTYVGD